ncbi:hypothetical protein CR513_47044, partial [Mucuna pruriens]
MDRSMIDATNGGALIDKMPIVARHLISNTASNTQQFGIKGAGPFQMVNEVGAIDNLTSLVRQLAIGQHQPSIAARVCGICTSMEHPTDMFPTFNHTRVDNLIINNLEGNNFGQVQVKGHMWLNDLDLPQVYLPTKVVIGSRVRNIMQHHSNSSNNRDCHLKATHHLWRT